MSKMRMRRLARQPFGPWEKRLVERPFRPGPGEEWLLESYVNNRYSVQQSLVATADFGTIRHLWVRRHGGRMANSWSDLQRIKNELVPRGRERVAVQVYPPVEELVDQANLAHLWVFPVGYRLPFRLAGGGGGE